MDEKGHLKAHKNVTCLASLVGDAKDIVDEFTFAVSYKEKDCLNV